ncbi:MAG: doubled motif LPXTG anchor domain-containing protein, partial [Faecalibacterium sp.]|nr:doubled motif LPXTG anchor domain-containing protein [Faecalibacterium sp.]
EPTPEPTPVPTPVVSYEPVMLVDIEPEPVPLAPAPVVKEAEDDLVEILDEDVPLADVPKTGDISILWAALSLGSAGGLAVLRKKGKEE